MFTQDYMEEMKTVQDTLLSIREDMSRAKTLSELNRLENDARRTMLHLQHCALMLPHWLQNASAIRRRELREAPVIVDSLHTVSEPEPEPKSKTRVTTKSKSRTARKKTSK